MRASLAAVAALALVVVSLGNAASSIPNGVYRSAVTHGDLAGFTAEEQATNVGTWTLTLSNGTWKIVNRPPPNYPPGDHIAGTYTSAGRVVTFLHKTPKFLAGIAVKVTWSFDGTALHLKPVSGFPAEVVKLIWTKHPWRKLK